MNLTGFFVEYLIIGSTALLWLLLLLSSSEIPLPSNKTIIVLLAPTLYVIGMVIDVLGHYITLLHKNKIGNSYAMSMNKYGVVTMEHAAIEVTLLSISPDIAKSAAARTSRTRVARGTLTNALITVPTWLFIFWSALSVGGIILIASAGFIGIIALWGVWARWQHLIYRFEVEALSRQGSLNKLQ